MIGFKLLQPEEKGKLEYINRSAEIQQGTLIMYGTGKES